MSATAISTAAMVHSSIAAQEAKKAKLIACQGFVDGFQHNTSTVEQRKAYSDCIQLMQPNVMSGGEVLVVKIMIIVCFLGVIGGLIKAWRENAGGGDYFFYALIGGVGGPLAIFLLGAAIAGIGFVMN